MRSNARASCSTREVAVRAADQLHAHRQAVVLAEADRHRDARQAGERRVDRRPPSSGGRCPSSRPAIDSRPAPLDRERPDLRARQREHVVAVEERAACVRRTRVRSARACDGLHAGERLALVVLPQRLGLDARAVRGVLEVRRDARGDAPAPPRPATSARARSGRCRTTPARPRRRPTSIRARPRAQRSRMPGSIARWPPRSPSQPMRTPRGSKSSSCAAYDSLGRRSSSGTRAS